jgi:hypothetical protein
MRKTHLLLPCQFCFARLSLVRITPFRWYHPNILIRRGSFNFQRLSLLFLSIGMFGWFNALYIEPTRLSHSHVDSNKIRQGLLVNGHLPNIEVRRSKMQVVVLIDLSRISHLEVSSPLPWPWYHLCGKQYYAMLDTILEEWLYLATYPPRT